MPFPRFLRRLIVLGSVFCLAAGPAQAQEEKQPVEVPRCSVVTVAPGDSLDALFGHTAIRIKDERLTRIFGTDDVWFDYGVFDMSEWTFWIHYAKGDARYMMIAGDPERRLEWYKEQGRSVVEQKLALTQEEARKLEDFLLDDLENGCGKKGYAYRFLDDNCTTRAVRAIRQAVGYRWQVSPLGETYRTWSDIQMAPHPWARLGANLFMGSHADNPNDFHSDGRIFLPCLLQSSVSYKGSEVWKYSGPAEQMHAPFPPYVPLSADGLIDPWMIKAGSCKFLPLWWTKKTTATAISTDVVTIPTTVDWPLAVFSLLSLALALPTLLRWKKRKPLPARGWLDAILFGHFGLIGSLMAFLGVWSLHPELGAFNWNLIWCWPTHLLFAAGLLFFPRHRHLRLYARVAAVGSGLAALAWFFVPQALPIPLFPMTLLLGLRAARRGWEPIQKPNDMAAEIR